jgi:hypothetical protein
MGQHPEDPIVRILWAMEQNELYYQLVSARSQRLKLEKPVTVTYNPRKRIHSPVSWDDLLASFTITAGEVSVDEDITVMPVADVLKCAKCHVVPFVTPRGDGRVVYSCQCVGVQNRPWEALFPGGRLFGKWYLIEAAKAEEVARTLLDDRTCSSTSTTPGFLKNIPNGAHLVDIITNDKGAVQLFVHSWRNLVPGGTYFLLPRVVDFSCARVMSVLSTVDREGPARSLFLRMLKDANDEALSPHNSWRGTIPPVDPGALRPSQQACLERWWESGFQVLWGPPGTGKTHYMATCIVALLKHHVRNGLALHIAITCFTVASIANLLAAVRRLMPEDIAKECGLIFCHGIPMEGVIQAKEKPEVTKAMNGSRCSVIGATVHRLQKVIVDQTFDAVFVDEATQLRAVYLAIPLSMLHSRNWGIMVGGDFLQLPPILHGGPYYLNDPTEPNVFSSAMHALLQSKSKTYLPIDASQAILQLQEGVAQWPSLAILTETSRCNEGITELTKGLYGGWYKALHNNRVDIREGDGGRLPAGLAPSLITVMAPQDGTFAQYAALAREWVVELQSRGPEGLSIAVVTPFRVMRDACIVALSDVIEPSSIDTVERMQGQERDVVLIMLSVPKLQSARIPFLLNLCRVNVAITRARMMCILVLTPNVISPPWTVVSDRNALACRDHLTRFVETSAIYDK